MRWSGPGSTTPMLVLGDHGFLPQYGSRLTRDEILARMRHALRLGIPALAAGEIQVSSCAMEAFRLERQDPCWVRHVDVPVTASGRVVDAGPAFALLRELAIARFGSRLNEDMVMSPFFESFKETRPLRRPAADFEIGSDAMAGMVGDIISRRPFLVTAGGDWLDLLVACRRMDLVAEFLDMIGAAAQHVGARLHVCTYLGFAWGARFQPVADRADVSGFMIPVNSIGAGMLPRPATLLGKIAERKKSISAMHILMFGSLEVEESLIAAAATPGVEYLIVGASRETHIEHLARAGARLAAMELSTP